MSETQQQFSQSQMIIRENGDTSNDQLQKSNQYIVRVPKFTRQNIDPESHRVHKEKRQVVKKSFIYLHKYFLAKDIEYSNFTLQKARKYAHKLSFQTYVPQKLGLPNSITSEYCEWFFVFFAEFNDERPQIMQAAYNLYEILVNEGGRILKLVKGSQLCHLKILLQVSFQKLGQQYSSSLVKNVLKIEVSQFIQQNRIYETSISQLYQLLKPQLNSRKNLNSSQMRSIFVKIVEKVPIDDLVPLMIEYLKIYSERKDQPVQDCIKFIYDIKKMGILYKELITKYLQDMRSRSKVQSGLIDFFCQNYQDQ